MKIRNIDVGFRHDIDGQYMLFIFFHLVETNNNGDINCYDKKFMIEDWGDVDLMKNLFEKVVVDILESINKSLL